MPLGKAYDYTSVVMTKNMRTQDAKEGIASYVERRTPRFTGK